MMDVSDYELDRGLMCQAIGKAVSGFVSKYGIEDLLLTIACDKPEMTYDGEGQPHRGVNIRVYMDKNDVEDDSE